MIRNNKRGRNGRTPGTYKKINGVITRLYDPIQKCQRCGQRAAMDQVLCHDCLGESTSEQILTLDEIAAEAALIKEENLAKGSVHSPHPVGVPAHTEAYSYNVEDYQPKIYRCHVNGHRRGKVI